MPALYASALCCFNAIAPGPDGALWFTAGATRSIRRITTAGVVTLFPLPGEACPDGITVGPDDAIWFTDVCQSNVGRLTTSGFLAQYPVPSARSQPLGITTGPDGELWFSEFGAAQIGHTIGACSGVPVISGLSADPAILWPPNHQMVNVNVGYNVTSHCGAPSCSLSITSNQPPQGSNDWAVLSSTLVALRAERDGADTDRTYTVELLCKDEHGNAASKSVNVVVPHDNRK